MIFTTIIRTLQIAGVRPDW